MIKPLISVIIPVYQASDTIKRCVESIVSTSSVIEIICVDDGSRDDSLTKLQSMAADDDRLVVIHQENAGAGAARNNGLKHASGEYVMFCDADDAYQSDTIDIIVGDVKKYTPDYIVFHRKTLLASGGSMLWGDGNSTTLLNVTPYEYLNDVMQSRGHGMGVVTKVLKKSIIDSNNIQFKHFTFGEDLWFNVNYILCANSFVEEYGAYYLQYQQEGSICMKSYPNYLDLNIECIEALKKEHSAIVSSIQPFICNHYYNTVTWSLSRVLQGVDATTFSEKLKKIQQIMIRDDVRDICHTLLSNPDIDVVKRRNCSYILNGCSMKYAFRNHYLNQIKKSVRTIIKKIS